MLESILSHIPMILTCLLVLSEAAAAIVQLAFPGNKGVSGVLAGIIKFLQAVGAKKSSPSE